MELIKDTSLELGYRVWQASPPTPSLTIVIKATFDLGDGAPCALAAEQELCGGDLNHDDDEEMSLRLENDFAILKPRGECFLVGSCFVPRGRQTTQLQAGFVIGEVKKGFVVTGDRFWEGGMLTKPSKPVPFSEMPLRPERSFGGPGHKTNPWGVGYKGHAPEPTRALPNIERPDAQMTSPRAKVDPVLTTPIPMGDKRRIAFAGTYDKRWLRTRWPFFPEDFRWEYFQAAPEDQRIKGYWRGDEAITLFNLHRQRDRLKTSLPGLRPRVFLDRLPAAGPQDFREVALNLDTVTIDTDRAQIFCVWRGLENVTSEDLDDIANIFVAQDTLEGRQPKDAFYERMQQLLRQEEEEEKVEEEAPAAEPEQEPPAEEEPDEALAAVEREEADADAKLAQITAEQPQLDPPPDETTPEEVKQALLAAPFKVPEPIFEALDDIAAATEPEPDDTSTTPPDPDERARFLELLGAGQGFSGETFADVDLSGLDLRGEDLSGVVFERASFTEADLRGATLDGAQLAGCELLRARLDRARLVEADLTGCNAQEATFTGAQLDGVTGDQGRFIGCDLREASANGASFIEADLSRTNWSGASMVEVELAEATLTEAWFAKAVMTDANLEGVKAKEASFDRAELTGLRAGEGADFTKSRFRGVTASGSNWEDSTLQDVDLSAARLEDAFFTNAVMYRVVLDHCQARGARFEKAILSHASARSANLFEADFEAADLSFANFSGANLFGAELWKANTDGTRFDMANVKRTKIGVLRT